MARGFKDREGVEWFPLWHGENLSDLLRYTGITLEQLQFESEDGSQTVTLPAFALVEAMWYTVRGQAREQIRRNIERTEFLRRFDPSDIVAAIAVLVESLQASMPTKEDIPATLQRADDDPLPETLSP